MCTKEIADWVAEEYPTLSTSLDMGRWPTKILEIRDHGVPGPVLYIRLRETDDGCVYDDIDDEELGNTFTDVRRELIRWGYFDLVGEN